MAAGIVTPSFRPTPTKSPYQVLPKDNRGVTAALAAITIGGSAIVSAIGMAPVALMAIGGASSAAMFRTYLIGRTADFGRMRIVQLAPPKLTKKITDVASLTAFDASAAKDAESSVAQALNFVKINKISAVPAVDMSEDGVLSLEWGSDLKSILLVFYGDGTAFYSLKKNDGFYSGSISEFSLSDTPPIELIQALTDF